MPEHIRRTIASANSAGENINVCSGAGLGMLYGKMKTSVKRLLFWTPRILGLLFAAFISLFALDVFDGHHGFWQTALAFAMHLIPTAILLLLLALAWRWEWTGAVSFTALAVFYLVVFRGRFHWSAYAVISGPLFLLGLLFLLNWLFRAGLRKRPDQNPITPASTSAL